MPHLFLSHSIYTTHCRLWTHRSDCLISTSFSFVLSTLVLLYLSTLCIFLNILYLLLTFTNLDQQCFHWNKKDIKFKHSTWIKDKYSSIKSSKLLNLSFHFALAVRMYLLLVWSESILCHVFYIYRRWWLFPSRTA